MNGMQYADERYQNYLLVEGNDDKHVLLHLLEYHRLFEQFRSKDEQLEIQALEGLDNLLNAKTLRAYIKIGQRRRFGIIVDADTNMSFRWQRLRDILEGAGYNTVPNEPTPEGTILRQNGLATVGVWLMPDNTVPGMLEDFVSFMISPNDVLWPMANDIVQQVVEKDCRFPATQVTKARIHTWLSWQEKPGRPIGLAITARYLDATAPHAQQLLNWLRRLFELN
jgi:hypothetical protein